MTKEELLQRLADIEWDDFEVKEAKGELPKNIWDTVCAFANTSGGWIVLGVQEVRKNGKVQYHVTGVGNAEKLEQDFIGTLRSQTKFNLPLMVRAQKYQIGNHTVLAFQIASSLIKPVYFNNNLSNTFIRTGSGDQHATEMEILAIQRDQAFGSRSEQAIPGTSFNDLNLNSLHTYRRRIQEFNNEFAYNNLDDESFCRKVGIIYNDNLTYASLLMLGKRDAVQNAVHNFWIDYIEIPGTSYQDATTRYTYRMPEQENIWEYYQVLIQRLRLYANNPFTTGPDGFAPDDNSQLYALREGLVNLCAHADYFSPMHSTIRIFDNRIEFQNAGRFYIDFTRVKEQIVSMPRNPSIIKFFRYAKLSENAGYGIDKMMKWESLTGQKVIIATDIVSSTVTYMRSHQGGQDKKAGGQEINYLSDNKEDNRYKTGGREIAKSGRENEQGNRTRQQILSLIKENPSITRKELSDTIHISQSAIQKHLEYLKEHRIIERQGSTKSGSWKML